MVENLYSKNDEVWVTYKYSDYSTIEVSNFGNVKKEGRELNKRINHDGYFIVALNKGKKKNGWDDYANVFVHRLVMCAFIDERFYKDGWEVNHKDYNRQNNHVDNLEWITHADNVRYSVCNRKNIEGENNPNYGNRKLSNIYKENPSDENRMDKLYGFLLRSLTIEVICTGKRINIEKKLKKCRLPKKS